MIPITTAQAGFLALGFALFALDQVVKFFDDNMGASLKGSELSRLSVFGVAHGLLMFYGSMLLDGKQTALVPLEKGQAILAALLYVFWNYSSVIEQIKKVFPDVVDSTGKLKQWSGVLVMAAAHGASAYFASRYIDM